MNINNLNFNQIHSRFKINCQNVKIKIKKIKIMKKSKSIKKHSIKKLIKSYKNKI